MPLKNHYHDSSLSLLKAAQLFYLIYTTLTSNLPVSCSSVSSGTNLLQCSTVHCKNQTTHQHRVAEGAAHVRQNEIRPLRIASKCSTAGRDLDRCSAQIIGLGSSSPGYPESMDELNSAFCPRFRDTVSCVKNSTECYKPFERQIINWILTSTRRINYKRCRNENEKQRFLRLTNSCLINMKNPMDDCMGNYIGSLDAIANFGEKVERLTEADILIQLSCCANRRFKQCIVNGAKQRCSHQDSLRLLRRTNSISSQRVARKQLQRLLADALDDLKTTLDEMALTGPEFVCSGIDEKFCKVNFDSRYTGRLPRHKSIVPAMIKIYSSK